MIYKLYNQPQVVKELLAFGVHDGSGAPFVIYKTVNTFDDGSVTYTYSYLLRIGEKMYGNLKYVSDLELTSAGFDLEKQLVSEFNDQINQLDI